MSEDTERRLPRHVGYIVDGNRRWAKHYGIPAYEGHLAGYNSLKDVVFESVDQGIKYVSTYIFSTENWKRSADEVKHLMSLTLKILESDMPEFDRRGIRIVVAGSRDKLDAKLIKAIEKAEKRTAKNTAGCLVLCFNYGGQLEIVDAVKAIAAKGVPAEEITEELIAQHLYTPEVPPVDMVVRTSGEQRLSNFMLWRSAYSEFLFLEKNWPDMTKEDVTFIIDEYTRRQRRFGG